MNVVPLILIALAIVAIVVEVPVKKRWAPVPAGEPAPKMEPPIKLEPVKQAPVKPIEVKLVVLDPKVDVPVVEELKRLD